MDGTIFSGYNCNDGGKKYLWKCWGLKPKIYYNCRTPDQFVKDCPFIRSDGRSQLITVSDKNFI